MMWAVSQAAPLRRIEVENELLLYEYEPPIPQAGYSSGGYFANLLVRNTVSAGSQQQWFARDSTIGGWQGGSWNMVFVGMNGTNIPQNHCGNQDMLPITSIKTTPLISEKPYIIIDTNGKFYLQVPPLKRSSAGVDFFESKEVPNDEGTVSIDFSNIYVTQLNDTATIMNEKLNQGLHLVISPGIYHLDEPLAINHANQIILGLGLATLVSAKQNILISIGNVDGVRVCGLILQAGPAGPGASVAPTLLEWGRDTTSYPGDPNNPGFIHDVFARVGGPDGTVDSPVAVDSMVHIRNGNVIGDNMWLWRADHAVGPVTYGSNRCSNGMVVDGNDVSMYGLAVEHTEKDLTVWNGEDGATYFYQSELPYDVNQQQYSNYSGYRVSAMVEQHKAYGLGVYCFFRDHSVTVQSGIVAPSHLEPNFVHPLTVFLTGNGAILHVLNDKGNPSTRPGTPSYWCQ